MGDWSPGDYLKFEDYRTRPSVDLVSHIHLDEPASVIDLGCGPGNSTQVIRARWPRARVLGMDSSVEMIEAANAAYPEQDWAVADIADWTAEVPFDLVFSNAALQWVSDHTTLLPRLLKQVAPGGALAVQVPAGMYATIRGLIHEVSEDPAWSPRMSGARNALNMESAETYYDVLSPLAKRVDIWETEYQHVLESPSAIIEWISSTGLRPFLDALDDDAERERFTALLLEMVTAAYPVRADGKVLFGFRRVFFVAYR